MNLGLSVLHMSIFLRIGYYWTHALQGSYEIESVCPLVRPFFYHSTFFRIGSLIFFNILHEVVEP